MWHHWLSNGLSLNLHISTIISVKRGRLVKMRCWLGDSGSSSSVIRFIEAGTLRLKWIGFPWDFPSNPPNCGTLIWGVWWQKGVWRAGTSNYIPQIMSHVIICALHSKNTINWTHFNIFKATNYHVNKHCPLQAKFIHATIIRLLVMV